MARRTTIKIPKFYTPKPFRIPRGSFKMPKLPRFNIKPIKI